MILTQLPIPFLRILLMFCSLFFYTTSHAQTLKIEANIIDTTLNSPIKDVKAMLVNIRDSVIVTHRTTDEKGQFQITNIPLDTFRLILSHPNYEPRELFFLANENNHTFEIKNLVLYEKGKKIEEITIFAYKDPVHYKGDTLVYVADSFHVRPNAVVEDLLKKLPGISVESDGKIKSQGKEISRVYVDGDEFFGSDATLATKNLAASSVERVQVYETTLPDAQAGDEKVQVIDLRLKDEAKKGYFGKTSFGTDFSRFFEGQLLANRFSNKQKISVFFMGTNTTNTALDWQDANQFGIENQNNYLYNAETDSWESNADFLDGSDGFPMMFKSGVYYTDQISEKLKIGANYTFSDYRKRTAETSNNSYFLPDTTFYTSASAEEHSHQRSHLANFNFEYSPDSLNTFVFEPKFKFSNKEQTDLSFSNYQNASQISQRNTSNTFETENDALNMKFKLGYTRKFQKDKRELRMVNNFVYDDSNNDENLNFEDRSTQNMALPTFINQQKQGNRSILSNLFQIVYVEPITKKIKMEFSYELFNTTNQQNRMSYNLNGAVYNDLDSLTSGAFKSIKLQNRIRVSMVYDFKKHMVTIGAYGRHVTIENQDHFNQKTINQSLTNILPNVTYLYRIGRNSQFRTSLTANSNLPDIGFLQPIVNNSNPNNIHIGNPNLKPNYTFHLNSNFNTYNPLKGSYVYGGIYAGYGFNDFISSIDYDQDGRSTLTYMNGNTLNYVGSWMGGGIPLIKQVFILEPGLNYQQSNRYNYISSMKNILNTYTVNPSIDLNLMTEVVEFTAGFDYSWSKNTNSTSKESNLTNNIIGVNGGIRGFLPWKMEIGTEMKYSMYRNLGQDYNLNILIWNAQIKQKFGKNENFEIAVQANDILNQNTQISRSALTNVITDTRKLIIARYFMLNVTYRFNSTFKKTKTQEEDEKEK